MINHHAAFGFHWWQRVR